MITTLLKILECLYVYSIETPEHGLYKSSFVLSCTISPSHSTFTLMVPHPPVPLLMLFPAPGMPFLPTSPVTPMCPANTYSSVRPRLKGHFLCQGFLYPHATDWACLWPLTVSYPAFYLFLQKTLNSTCTWTCLSPTTRPQSPWGQILCVLISVSIMPSMATSPWQAFNKTLLNEWLADWMKILSKMFL